MGLAKAKADHDETHSERKQVHELTVEEKKELRKLQAKPVREEYESGVEVFVGQDVEAAVGMRVRMREGLISHGVGTITCLGNDAAEDAGCCEVVWDSDQMHVMAVHVRMGNRQSCRIGKEGHHDLILVSETLCSDLTIVHSTHVLHGKVRERTQVFRRCDEEEPVDLSGVGKLGQAKDKEQEEEKQEGGGLKADDAKADDAAVCDAGRDAGT